MSISVDPQNGPEGVSYTGGVDMEAKSSFSSEKTASDGVVHLTKQQKIVAITTTGNDNIASSSGVDLGSEAPTILSETSSEDIEIDKP